MGLEAFPSRERISVGQFEGRHDFSLEQRQDIGVVADFFLNDWIFLVVAGGFEEKSVEEKRYNRRA